MQAASGALIVQTLAADTAVDASFAELIAAIDFLAAIFGFILGYFMCSAWCR